MVPTRTSTRSCRTSSRAMLSPISGLNFSSRVTNSIRAPCTPSRLISCSASLNPFRASFPNTAGGPLYVSTTPTLMLRSNRTAGAAPAPATAETATTAATRTRHMRSVIALSPFGWRSWQ